MYIQEYLDEKQILIENIQALKDNLNVIKLESAILKNVFVEEVNKDELVAIKSLVSQRNHMTEEMLNNLQCAYRYIKENKVKDSVYSSYIERYTTLVKQYVEKFSADSYYLYLANKYIGNIDELVVGK